ncbi:hypothetical protein [Halorhabdus amylolytica]|uniref:hypothetical protein n=1 Tax=Halorhabdus amylolytica TaxID=2559573 RepID=UPI0010AAB2FC|nr:hypothetical protein [Halorhabdus amylolytica]
MPELADSMDVLTDVDAWTRAATVGGGYAGSAIVDSLIVGATPGPDEAAGIAAGAGVAAGSYAFAPREFRRDLVTGGMLFSVGSAAEYFGFKETILELGGGN